MDDGGAADAPLRPRAPARGGSPRGFARLLGTASARSALPHHRRRRALALAGVACVALLAGISAGAGGGTAAGSRVSTPTGYFARLRSLAGNGPGSLAAAQLSAENEAINRTLSYTPYVRIAGAQHRELALTFDDGPGPYTPQILSVLQRENVPSTFFEVGVMEAYFHGSTTAILARGYPIGDHTESHALMGKLPALAQRSQLLQQTSAIGVYGAPFPRLFRPPYGSWDAATLRLLARYRMLMVLWSVDSNDYRLPGVRAIVHSAVAGARPGAIVLLHDGGGNRSQTVAALPRIISALRARGYRFVTIPRLLLDNPAPRNQEISAVIGGGS